MNQQKAMAYGIFNQIVKSIPEGRASIRVDQKSDLNENFVGLMTNN